MLGNLREARPEIIKKYMSKGKNIFLVGPHGVGKTSMVRQAAQELGWNLKEFNTALMDPQLDMTGIPQITEITTEDNVQKKAMSMVRNQKLDEADVLMFDEFQRGHINTLNAIMNVINDRMINDEVLPNLKSVVVASNPMKDETTGISYSANYVDEAILDRFDVYMSASTKVNKEYLSDSLKTYSTVNKLGYDEKSLEKIAELISDWQHSIKFAESTGKKRAPYISPRRCEKMAHLFLDFPYRRTLDDVLGVSSDSVALRKLFVDLQDTLGEGEESDLHVKWSEIIKNGDDNYGSVEYEDIVNDIYSMNMESIKETINRFIESNKDDSRMIEKMKKLIVHNIIYSNNDKDTSVFDDIYNIIKQ